MTCSYARLCPAILKQLRCITKPIIVVALVVDLDTFPPPCYIATREPRHIAGCELVMGGEVWQSWHILLELACFKPLRDASILHVFCLTPVVDAGDASHISHVFSTFFCCKLELARAGGRCTPSSIICTNRVLTSHCLSHHM